MKITECPIQSTFARRYSSSVRPIRIHLENFRYNHKDNPYKEDVYINREKLENKLKSWLLGDDQSGAYLVAGYRGMGKSSLVNHVIQQITRRHDIRYERLYRLSVGCIFGAFVAGWFGFIGTVVLLSLIALALAFLVVFHRYVHHARFLSEIRRFPHTDAFSKELVRKILAHKDDRACQYNRIKIKVNLGREVLNERDVLCLITNQIRGCYERYLQTGHNKPVYMYLRTLLCCTLTMMFLGLLANPVYEHILAYNESHAHGSHFLQTLWLGFFRLTRELETMRLFKIGRFLLVFWLCYSGVHLLYRWLLSYFDRSQLCLKKLCRLSERLTSAVSEVGGGVPPLSNSLFSISLFSQRQKKTPAANVRDIETELADIINQINSEVCLPPFRVQFLIVLDELDKVEYKTEKDTQKANTEGLVPPDFSTAIEGFSGAMTNSDRRRTVLQLLANMKLFLTSARAKFIFISGRELYEAFLADLSDREYAISSIFSGVINVNSFLYPEREQSDISSMTEQYVSEILLPPDYLWRQTEKNARQHLVLKREIPSLRWYTQYLTELAAADPETDPEERRMEIRHIVLFLHCFVVYLSHVSNGSPKKIVLYFEKYVQRFEECLKLTDWNDMLVCGDARTKSTPAKPRYVLWFTPGDQQKIGFVFHLAAPIMNVITSNHSNYDDKLLIAASFLVDHLFKFHGRGFSWNNIEQTPELLDVNKTIELRDFISSIFEFMQQIHIAPVMVGLFQYKFHKRISEEISYISRISDEAAAMFNFTLNETQPVKYHAIKLLNYYMELSGRAEQAAQRKIYDDVVARIHITLADLYFQEEDYSRALKEYQSALNHLDRRRPSKEEEEASSIILRISCMLKMGLTHEYCKAYESAYIVYCSLVDAMITVREVAEKELGLDIIDRWTDDWRIKQPMILDYGVRRRDDGNRKLCLWLDEERYARYRTQMVNGMWNDESDAASKGAGSPVRRAYDAAEYSLDFDRMVSGLSKNLSPEKSRIITRLAMFEDVRLIYKAILAKLFVLEKMNMSGITQSNVEVAEAEFKYLHRTINIEEKFFISADFFNQLGKILFYKNSLGLLSDGNVSLTQETLRAALYWRNVDLYAYLDDFCFRYCKPQRNAGKRLDAVEVKRTIRAFFNEFPLNRVNGAKTLAECLRLVKIVKTSHAEVALYADYLLARLSHMKTMPMAPVFDCSAHRCEMRKQGWSLPCYACKYYNQSLQILKKEMFVPIDPTAPNGTAAPSDPTAGAVEPSDELWLLRRSFRPCLRSLRINHMRLLAMNIVSMGNTMYSCAADKTIAREVLDFVRDLLKNGKDAKKQDMIGDFICVGRSLNKLEKAVLYYMAAYRFFNMVHQSKEANDCLSRILRMLNEWVTLVNFDKKTQGLKADRQKAGAEKADLQNADARKVEGQASVNAVVECVGILTEDDNLLDILFTRYAKSVAKQYGYTSLPEMRDYKWLFHMNDNEDIDLKRLQTYTELTEVIWLISDIRIKVHNVSAYFFRSQLKLTDWHRAVSLRRQELVRAYTHFRPLGRIRDTFYNEIIVYYARFRLNKWIQKDLFDLDPLVDSSDSHRYVKPYNINFVRSLRHYLAAAPSEDKLDRKIFEIADDPKDRLQLIEFLLEDSIVCLTEIIQVLTPYNHISSFSNSFVAEVYNQLWEQAQMYETLILLYDCYRYGEAMDVRRRFDRWKEYGITMTDDLYEEILACLPYIVEDHDLRERYGSLSNRIFMRIRHKIDDRTMHHVMSNYAAEMALHYYVLAEESHSEGRAYRNQVTRNYMLNDDLDNDTWLFNTTLERFRLHSQYIANHRRRLVQIYRKSRFYRLASYVNDRGAEGVFGPAFEANRFDDALYTNSEL